MKTLAVIMEKPEHLALGKVELVAPGMADVVVEVLWSGISTGTEKLLWSGRMPGFPGLSYPLVPGYESVGRVIEAGAESGLSVGDLVFVPGSRGFKSVAGLFGGAARRVVVEGRRVTRLPEALAQDGILLALAATAHHAVVGGAAPELIIGHGVLGRLIARLTIALGHAAPMVWESNPLRTGGAEGYPVSSAQMDGRCDYRAICDVSGEASLLDTLILRLAKGGEITLAGFYSAPVSFVFPPAFMREARLRVSAEWQPADLAATLALIQSDALSLEGLISHRAPARDAASAYATAFNDPACTKMVLDWSDIP
jgi:bacteriochlorophyllide a dehydrogenase